MRTETVVERSSRAATVEAAAPLWVSEDRQADAVVRSDDRSAVWVVARRRLATRIIRRTLWPRPKAGSLVLLDSPRPEALPALMKRFEKVAYAEQRSSFLPKAELMEALASADARDRFIGGVVDAGSRTLTLWRGDLTSVVVPFAMFAPAGNGMHPDFRRFAVTDYGHSLRFGEYEAAADAVLYEHDPDFRRRLRKRRIAQERTLGASIRRLRLQRRLTRDDFPGLEPKTLARIERGEVKRPHPRTKKLIADRLRVRPEELGSY